ncbi:MAG TPA: hypothetical protein VHS99_24660, partial [Chloroflexota bacterium]|nr:hypothetical protein [Chloroflexota bacterium]
MSDSAPRRVGRAGGGDTRRRRRLILLAVLGPVGAVTAAALLSEPRSSAPDAGPAVDQAPGSVLAYLVATGIFAQPPAEQRPEAFAAAEVAAAEAGASLAFTVWTERE